MCRRHEHATKIQVHGRVFVSLKRVLELLELKAVFRGWRTRRRVVWQVRAELEALVDEMQMNISQYMVPGFPSPSSFTLSWMEDMDNGHKDGRRQCHLRLPRIQDELFGATYSFPLDLRQEHETDPNDDAQQEDAHAINDTIDSAVDTREQSQQFYERAMNSVDDAASEHSDVKVAPNPMTSISIDPTIEVEDVSSDRILIDKQNGLSLEGILATHSKADILLELEWAKQALRDRRKLC